MLGYIVRRTLQALVVILGVTLIVFLLSQLIPGGQARAALGPKATQLQIAHFNHVNGYDEPLWRKVASKVDTGHIQVVMRILAIQ